MALIKTVEIENFQSHIQTKLNLNQGLNVVVGPSDQGKSAVIRALRWVCYNEPRGTDFFRVSSNSCRVRIELDSGEEIIRERTSSKNRYIYRDSAGEEKIFEGFGNNVPWEINKILRMPKVSLDTDTETSLNIGQQLEGPFLLNESGTLRAKMIGRLTGAHIIDTAIREVAKDLLTQQQEEKRTTEELKEIEERLDQFQYLPRLLRSIEKEEAIYQQIIFLNERRKLLLAVKEKWDVLCREEEESQKLLELLQPLDKVERILGQAELASQLHNQLKRMSNQRLLIGEEIKGINVLLQKAKQLEKLQNIVMQAEESLKTKQELIQLQDKIKNWKKEHQQVKLLWESLSSIELGKEKIEVLEEKLKALKSLQSLYETLQKLEKEKNRIVKERDKSELDLQENLEAYQKKLKESGKCPLCFSSLDENVLKNIINNYGGGR